MKIQNLQTYAFVVGVARSGTTVTAEILNAHPEVCIGMERYKRLYRRKRAYPPELFTKDRFFTFKPNDTSYSPGQGRWDGLYRSMEAKWDTASVIGDKEGYAAMDYIFADIPQPHIIFMLRPVEQVASSWNVRAAKAQDSWPANNDFRMAVNKWNEANSIAYHYISLGRRLFILDYERFFSGSEHDANALLRFLGVETGEKNFMNAFASAAEHYRETVASKRPLLLEGQDAFIEREANWTTFKRLRELAKRQLETA